MNKTLQQDKVRGSLIGGAIGDALGYPVEFISSFEGIQRRYGKCGITRLDTTQWWMGWVGDPIDNGKAIISDDTQMTLYTAYGILNALHTGCPLISAIRKAYIEWYLGQNGQPSTQDNKCWLRDITELNKQRAPGITCMTALREILNGGEGDNNSKGCGGVMRIAPVPLYGATLDDDGEARIKDIQTVDQLAADAAIITHRHPLGYIPAALEAHIIYRLMLDEAPSKESLKQYINEGMDAVRNLYPQHKKEVDYLGHLVSKALVLADDSKDDVACIGAIGEGWVGEEALTIALYCAVKYFDDFEKAVIVAVNHKGDSDSTGAVLGNILGTAVGYNALPQHFKTKLEFHDVILRMADDLWKGETKWNAQKFLEEYIPWSKKGGSWSYYKIREMRVAEFQNTVGIVQQGYYTTDTGKHILLDDGTKMTAGTVFYDQEFHISTPVSTIEVVNEDCLSVGIRLKQEGYNPAILNMASRRNPGGGVTAGAGAQEETLFRRTDLFRSLYQFAPYATLYGVKMSCDHQYPLDRDFGGIYTPDATIFRESEKEGYKLMEEPVKMSFISVAGINCPELTPDGMIADYLVEAVKNKIRTILRIGLQHNHDALVLGALGCGAFCNPPRHVAKLFHEVFRESEFNGRFRIIVFAILDDHNAHKAHNPEGNYLPFAEEFAGTGSSRPEQE